MSAIEQDAKLPKGAGKLDDYARFYSDAGDGQIIATYLLPSVIRQIASEECEQLTSVSSSRMVSCVLPEVEKASAGERIWIADQGNLPFEVRPGCEVITMAYSLVERRFEELGCVGHRPREEY
jgi:hypothetical protein